MRGRHSTHGVLQCGILAAASSLACSETEYHLLSEDPAALTDPCKGAGGALPSGCEPADTSLGGSPAQSDDTASDTTDGTCVSERDPNLLMVRLVAVDSNRCLHAGEFVALGDDPSYGVEVAPCDGTPSERWTLLDGDPAGLAIRNEWTNFNLDVRFASPENGTSAILFEPHQLYNQRFRQLPIPDGEEFRLEARHAEGKCLAHRSGRLELWPCDTSAQDQLFTTENCR